MAADFIIKQGDSAPVFEEQLIYSNKENVNLEGATVKFILRSLSSTEQVKLSGTVEVTKASEGKVIFKPAVADTTTPGNYMANWSVTFESGKIMQFPTQGYLWVEIQPNLTSKGGIQLIQLPEVKEHLEIPENDHIHDGVLLRFIKAAQPLIENLTGPILSKVHSEWYEGGHSTIALRHAPSYGYGTTPFITLMAVEEYRGPIGYALNVIGTPTQGTVYSVQANAELGTIIRATAGGGTYNFWRDPTHPQRSVHVKYAAGQEIVPENVNFAAIETVRWWWQTTMAVGKGALTLADAEEGGGKPMVGLPYHVKDMLGPARRAPVCG